MNQDDYQSTALFYDRVLTPLLRPLRVDIRTFVHYRGHRNIIDICCGTGDQLQLLEGNSMNLAGVDNSAAMLDKARARCSDLVSLHLLDAEQMSPPEDPFDCALLVFSLHEKHPAGRAHIFDNACRMVKPGGSLVLADYRGRDHDLKRSLSHRLLIPVIERLAGKNHYRNYRDWMDRGGLEGFLQRRNLTVDVISQRFGSTVLCCALTIDDARQAFSNHLALLNRSLHKPIKHLSYSHEQNN
ncbi:MAG: class I SAM-dependent methyltransferase [Desulfofustis sp.]|nr:class I SAM-dependent methyltransferase [Desulfofustis sp.]